VTIKKFVFNGLGFPVVIVNPKFHADGSLAVKYNQLSQAAFEWLITKECRMSGAQVKFARHYMEMTQADFAKALCQSGGHSIVSKWEGKDLEASGMQPSTELLLRLVMAGSIGKPMTPLLQPLAEALLLSKGVGPKLEIPASLAA
jgi:DNA-binding transcriptional regulator YiaG